ncbi:MAG TPA: YceH family protein [Burkholderiales bacterium]
MPHPTLSPTETRALAVLAEKERTVPDTYPLTLNTLLSGCNQKTSRDPVMSLTESEVQQALDTLKYDNLAIESSGSRVPRYSHNIERVLKIPNQSTAILAVLMLRGPQTAGELRIHCDRMHKFADISAVEGFLNELANHADGPLVEELPRQPGARENRWAHRLSGALAAQAEAPAARAAMTAGVPEPDLAALRDDVAALQTEVEALKAVVEALRAKIEG